MTGPMPASVKVAIAALGAAVAVQITLILLLRATGTVGWGNFAFAAVLLALLLLGIVRGQRLAWLWGRYLGFFLAAASAVGLALNLRATPPAGLLIVLLGIAAPLLTASIALGRREAHGWFRLICPTCGAPTGRGDFLMRKARCSKCGSEF